MGKLHLYHISQLSEFPNETKRFIPRIPEYRASGENERIPRICVSDSLDGCFKAHPDAVHNINYAMDTEVLLEEGITGILYRVYHFLVDEEEVLFPNQLHSKGYVPDALDTNEHWILNEIKPVGISYVCLEKAGLLMEDSGAETLYTEYSTLGSWGLTIRREDFVELSEEVYDGALEFDTAYSTEEALKYIHEANKLVLSA